MSSNTENVSPIYKTEPIPEINHLMELVNKIPSGGNILEVGTFLGRTAQHMAERSDIFVTTIDSNADTQWQEDIVIRDKDKYEQPPIYFSVFNQRMYTEKDVRDFLTPYKNVQYIVVDMLKYEPDITYDLIFIDASKTYSLVFAAANKYKKLLNPNGYLCFHDYSLDLEVKRAVDNSLLYDDDFYPHSFVGSLVSFWKAPT